MSAPRQRPSAALTLLTLALLAAGCTQQGTTPGGGAPAGGAPGADPSRTTEPKAATPPQTPHSERPSADSTTPAPTGAVTATQLPRAADLQALGGTWTEGETTTGNPPQPISACQRSSLSGTGATSVQVRRYAGPGGRSAAAAVLGFPDPGLAAQASQTLAEWWRTCGEVVTSNGGQNARATIDGSPVEVPGGSGRLTEFRWTQGGKDTGEAQGVAVVGNRVVVLAARGTTGASAGDHPVARSLPRAAERLRS